MFVVSVKRVKDILGRDLPEEKQYTEYGQDCKGYPWFGSLKEAWLFDSAEEAERVARDNVQYLKYSLESGRYDLSTLAIVELREEIHQYLDLGLEVI